MGVLRGVGVGRRRLDVVLQKISHRLASSAFCLYACIFPLFPLHSLVVVCSSLVSVTLQVVGSGTCVVDNIVFRVCVFSPVVFLVPSQPAIEGR